MNDNIRDAHFHYLRLCAFISSSWKTLSSHDRNWAKAVSEELFTKCGIERMDWIQRALQCPEFPLEVLDNLLTLYSKEELITVLISLGKMRSSADFFVILNRVRSLLSDCDVVRIGKVCRSATQSNDLALMFLEKEDIGLFLQLVDTTQSPLTGQATGKIKDYMRTAICSASGCQTISGADMWRICHLLGWKLISSEEGLLVKIVQVLEKSDFVIPATDVQHIALFLFKATSETDTSLSVNAEFLGSLWKLLRRSFSDQRIRFRIYDECCSLLAFDGPVPAQHTTYFRHPFSIARWLTYRAVNLEARLRDRHMDSLVAVFTQIEVGSSSWKLVQDAFSYAVDCILPEAVSTLLPVIVRLLNAGLLDTSFFLEPIIHTCTEELRTLSKNAKVDRCGISEGFSYMLQVLQVILESAGFGTNLRGKSVETWTLGPMALIATKNVSDQPKNVCRTRDVLETAWLKENHDPFVQMVTLLTQLTDILKAPTTWDSSSLIHSIPFDECCNVLTTLLQFASSCPEAGSPYRDFVLSSSQQLMSVTTCLPLQDSLKRWMRACSEDGDAGLSALTKDAILLFRSLDLQDVVDCSAEYTLALRSCGADSPELHQKVLKERLQLQKRRKAFLDVVHDQSCNLVDIAAFVQNVMWSRIAISYRDALYAAVFMEHTCKTDAQKNAFRCIVFDNFAGRVSGTSHQSARNLGAFLRLVLNDMKKTGSKDPKHSPDVRTQSSKLKMWQALWDIISNGHILSIINLAHVIAEVRDALLEDSTLCKKVEDAVATRMKDVSNSHRMMKPWLEMLVGLLDAKRGPSTLNSPAVILKRSWPDHPKVQAKIMTAGEVERLAKEQALKDQKKVPATVDSTKAAASVPRKERSHETPVTSSTSTNNVHPITHEDKRSNQHVQRGSQNNQGPSATSSNSSLSGNNRSHHDSDYSQGSSYRHNDRERRGGYYENRRNDEYRDSKRTRF